MKNVSFSVTLKTKGTLANPVVLNHVNIFQKKVFSVKLLFKKRLFFFTFFYIFTEFSCVSSSVPLKEKTKAKS